MFTKTLLRRWLNAFNLLTSVKLATLCNSWQTLYDNEIYDSSIEKLVLFCSSVT